MTTLNKLLSLLTSKQKKDLTILILLMTIGLFFEMIGVGIIIPVLGIILNNEIIIKYPIIESFIGSTNNQFHREKLIITALTLLVIVYFVKTIYLMFLTWRQSTISSNLSAHLAKKLFTGYLQLPYLFHTQRNSSDLIKNIQSEVNYFNNIAQSFITLTTEISGIIGIAFMLLLIEPIGALSVSGFLLFFALIFYRLVRNKLLKLGYQRQIEEGNLIRILNEGFGSIKISKLMGKTSYFINLFNKTSNSKSRTYSTIFALQQFPRLYIEFMGVLSLVIFILSMTLMSKPIDTLLPIIGVFVVAAFRLMPSVNRILGSMQNIRSAKPVVDLLHNEFLLINDNNTNQKSNNIPIEFTFNNMLKVESLYFCYPDTDKFILENISFMIKKGECIGLIGPSGSGKSTLVDILVGLLSPTSGKILVDNFVVTESLFEWKEKIGYVSQFIYLTDDTIRNNVAFGIPDEEIDDNAVVNAIKMAQLYEHVNNLPDTILTKVGEQGVQLSGGQRQRIGIARALYFNPDVLVFDEATSALDSNTESEVMESINSLKGKKTIIIIAHRLSTINICDKIFKIENGKIQNNIIN
jgi:ABC-type multidrug transport system fused ATPase/permease subunit